MRYYLNVLTNMGLIRDPDGGEFEDVVAARVEAQQSAREVMANELGAGRIPSADWRVEIANARGVVLDQVTFGEILNTAPSVPIPMAVREADLMTEAGAAVMEVRAIRLELRENLARARLELRTLSRLTRAIGNPYS
jgi:hypothetical protein